MKKEPTTEQIERLARKKLPDPNTYEEEHFTAMVENPFWSSLLQNTHFFAVEFKKALHSDERHEWEFQFFRR